MVGALGKSNRLEVVGNRVLRWILGLRWESNVRLEELLHQCPLRVLLN